MPKYGRVRAIVRIMIRRMELIAALTDALHLHCNWGELSIYYYSFPHSAILVTIRCFGMLTVIWYFISAPNIVA